MFLMTIYSPAVCSSSAAVKAKILWVDADGLSLSTNPLCTMRKIRNDMVQPMDYIYGAAGFVATDLVLPIRPLMDRDSPYLMSEEDIGRFNILAKVRTKGLVDD